jgi:hypothetical protein
MKILRTDEAFRESIFRILRAKPKYFYLSSFNISINSEILDMLRLMRDIKDVKVIIGLVNPTPKQLAFLRNTFKDNRIPLKLVTDFHMKSVVSDKKIIVGGRNLTRSGWLDLNFEISSQDNIVKMKREFDNIFKKVKNIW